VQHSKFAVNKTNLAEVGRYLSIRVSLSTVDKMAILQYLNFKFVWKLLIIIRYKPIILIL